MSVGKGNILEAATTSEGLNWVAGTDDCSLDGEEETTVVLAEVATVIATVDGAVCDTLFVHINLGDVVAHGAGLSLVVLREVLLVHDDGLLHGALFAVFHSFHVAEAVLGHLSGGTQAEALGATGRGEGSEPDEGQQGDLLRNVSH